MERRRSALLNIQLIIGAGIVIWMADLLLARIRPITTDIVIAVLVSYLIWPAVRPPAQRMPRALAILLVYVIGLAVVAGIASVVAPTIAAQATELAHDFPATMARAQAASANPSDPFAFLGSFEPKLRGLLAHYASRIEAFGGTAAGVLGRNAFGLVRGTVGALVDVVVILLLSFFFMNDVDRIRALFLRMVPRPHRENTDSFIDDCDRVIGGFVRGQVVLAVVVGVAATILLFACGIHYALLLGLMTGVFSIVPLVGPVIGAAPAILVAVFTAGIGKAILVLVLFVIVFELQSHVLTPVVIGRALGVSPLVIFLAILIGAAADGVLGMLLAVPLAGIARVAIDRIFPPEDPATHALKDEARAETVGG
jgi:predicted PurR-regulated permease PerM